MDGHQPQQHRVDEAEDRRVGADAEGQRRDHRRAESPLAPQGAAGQRHIARETSRATGAKARGYQHHDDAEDVAHEEQARTARLEQLDEIPLEVLTPIARTQQPQDETERPRHGVRRAAGASTDRHMRSRMRRISRSAAWPPGVMEK